MNERNINSSLGLINDQIRDDIVYSTQSNYEG